VLKYLGKAFAGGEHTVYLFWSMCVFLIGLLPGTHTRSQRRDAG